MIFLPVLWGNTIYSQTTASSTTAVEEVQVETKRLKKAMDTKNEPVQADSYYNIGETFFNSGNFPKSEEYYTKAKKLYEKLNDKPNIEKTARRLAQSQEKQNKITPAISNYSMAAQVSYSEKVRL
ncbi:tetratricopeptide repeat protein [Chryseobacterium sp. 1B4]